MINKFLLVTNIISFVLVLILTPFGIYEYIVGPKGLEDLLKKLRFPFGYTAFFIIFFTCLIIMFATFLIRKKLSGEI